jgi:hypothetical protein
MKSRNPCAESISAPPRFACAEPNSPNFMRPPLPAILAEELVAL